MGVQSWAASDVRAWGDMLPLSADCRGFGARLNEAGIAGDQLPVVTDADLRELGVTRLSDRLCVRAAAAQLLAREPVNREQQQQQQQQQEEEEEEQQQRQPLQRQDACRRAVHHWAWGEHPWVETVVQRDEWAPLQARLELAAADADFWLGVVSGQITDADQHLGDHEFVWGECVIDQSALDTMHAEQGCDLVSLVETRYDMTPRRIEQLFAKFGGLADGRLNVGQVALALKHQGFRLPAARQCLVQRVDIDLDGKLALPEFDLVVNRLRLAELTAQSASDPIGVLQVADYHAESVKSSRLTPNGHDGFFFGHRPKPPPGSNIPTMMRWVHVHIPTQSLVLRLAVKYHLHPLSVQDALRLARLSTRVDRYGHHHFVVLSTAHLRCGGSDGAVTSTKTLIGAFVAGPPLRDTVITVQITEEDDLERPRGRNPLLRASMRRRSSAVSVWPADPSPRARTDTDSSASISTGSLPGSARAAELSDVTGLPLGQRLATVLEQRLSEPGSRLRDERSDFVLAAVLDYSVDETQALAEAYRLRMRCLKLQLLTGGSAVPRRVLDEVSLMKGGTTALSRDARPTRQCIEHFIGLVSDDCALRLKQTRDRLDQTVDDLHELQTQCQDFLLDHNRYRDAKMNDTLFWLSVCTVVFMPVQFICGVYGMNFQKSDGSPGIPELTLEHGYLYFWLLVSTWLLGAGWYFVRRYRSALDQSSDL